MAKLSQEHLPRWLVYLIPLILGLAFSLAIFFVVWNKSLNSNNQNFLLETVSFKEKVTRNIIVLENVANNIQNIILISPDKKTLINNVMNNIFNDYPFIDGVSHHSVNLSPVLIDSNTQANQVLKNIQNKFYASRSNNNEISLTDIIDPLDYIAAVNSLMNGDSFSVSSPRKSKSNQFVLFSKLPGADSDNNKIELIALIVNKKTFFRDAAIKNDISIRVFSESRGLSGRQLLYNSMDDANMEQGWLIKTLEDQQSFQLDSYSIKFDFKKKVYWKEIDLALIGSSILIGLGITLLAVALVRAKEIQSRELRQRNILIQKTVDEQTKELALARDKAVDASRIKSEFLASMSHEIRTPLNAIIGISELMSETPLNTEQSKYIKIFRKAGDNLLSLVNDILDLSKIEAQQLVLEEIPFNLIDLIEETVDIYAIKAAEKKINLVGRVEPGTDTNRVGDPTRLRQIILNLISNALKFTEKGEIIVSVKKSNKPDEPEHLIFTVSDTGIGIPKDKLESIFASFTQVDSSTTRKYGGTGLGLTISKSLVHMMKGRIWVESEVGKGSTFSFSAELGHAEEVPAITGSFPVINLSNQKIIVVDDNSTNRLILKDTLEMMQAQVVEAASGQMALDIVSNNNDFTLYLIDYEMPEMDGIELAENFRKIGVNLKNVILISSAIYGEEIHRVKSLQLGAYVYKPLKRAELLQQISQVLYEDDVIDITKEEQIADSTPEKVKNILLVEDNEDNRLLVNAFLKDTPYKIDEAENGKIGLEKFTENDYDLVLMDVQMPIMDGHEATRKIRSWESLHKNKSTPVIALTAHAIREEIDKCIDAGCDTHLGKPIKKLTLLATIEQYI